MKKSLAIVVDPPKQGWFEGPGYTYTIEYEYGYLPKNFKVPTFTTWGTFRTNIMIHNSSRNAQKIFIKLLSLSPRKSMWLNRDPIIIHPDGAAEIEFPSILTCVDQDPSKGFSKGLIIIAHPIDPKYEKEIPLDVRAAYMYLVEQDSTIVRGSIVGGSSKDIEIIPAVKVVTVPLPPDVKLSW